MYHSINLKDIINLIIISCLITLFFYHLILYFGRKNYSREKYNFYYSLFVICLSAYFFFDSNLITFLINSKDVINRISPVVVVALLYFVTILVVVCVRSFLNIQKNLMSLYIFLTVMYAIAVAIGSFSLIYGLHYYMIHFHHFIVILTSFSSFVAIGIITYWIFISNDNKQTISDILIIIFYTINFISANFFKGNPSFDFFNKNYLFAGIGTFILAYQIACKSNREFRDLVELKENLEQKVIERIKEIEKAKEEIKKISIQKELFLVNVLHELKTPITIVCNYLESDISKRGYSKEIKIVKQNLDKLRQDMINSLDLEKAQKGKSLYLHEECIDFSAYLEKKVSIFKNMYLKDNIQISSSIDPNVYTDLNYHAADRIINNLIDNAIKYHNKEIKIFISLKKIEKENKLELIIEDNGIGISSEHITNIFEPYYQIFNQKFNYQGLGMGLNIVKKIVEEANGSIQVESKVGEGTRFIIFLSQREVINKKYLINDFQDIQMTSEKIELDFHDEVYQKNHKTILIVDDNKNMLSFLQNSLYLQYNIFLALNGRLALEKLQTIPKPDLIISDIMMDELNGIELLKEIKKNKDLSSVPFLFLSAKSTLNDKIDGLSYGAIDFIQKPFILDEIKYKINNILKNLDDNQLHIKKKMIKKLVNFIDNDAEEKPTNTNPLKTVLNQYSLKIIELRIIQLLLIGKMYKEISLELNIPINTLKKRVHSIYKKLNISNKIELINICNNKNEK